MDCVLGNRVGAFGRSQGGAIVLAIASILNGVKAAVSVNGSMGSVGGNTRYKDFLIPEIEPDLKNAQVVGGTLVNAS